MKATDCPHIGLHQGPCLGAKVVILFGCVCVCVSLQGGGIVFMCAAWTVCENCLGLLACGVPESVDPFLPVSCPCVLQPKGTLGACWT